jgi:hypothetical protein
MLRGKVNELESKTVPMNAIMAYGGVGVQLHPNGTRWGWISSFIPGHLTPEERKLFAIEYGAELVPKLVRALFTCENSIFLSKNRNMIGVQRICANLFLVFFISFLWFLCFSSILHALILSLVHPFLPLFLLPPLYISFCLTFPLFSSAARSLLFKTLKWVVHTGKQTHKQTNPRSRVLDKPIVLQSRGFPHFTDPDVHYRVHKSLPTVSILSH